jgi:hypothetical protein
MKNHYMFSINCFIEKETCFRLLGIFSILIVVGIITSNINIEKSFAVEKDTVSLSPSSNPAAAAASNSKLNTDLDHFFSCITNSVKKSDSSQLPKFFNNEPTKTEIAVCFKQTKQVS